jgi:hypothetical protein
MPAQPVDEIEMIRDWLKTWAADRKVILEDHGQVGFGRPCVGISHGNGYIDLGPQVQYGGAPGHPEDAFWYAEAIPEAYAPDGVDDAYHKHDCLAVLVHDDDYDKALRQLYLWVQSIDAAGLVIKTGDREIKNVIELALHGTSVTYLDKP